MNRKDYAAYCHLRDTARMDRGFQYAPAVNMPAKRKPAPRNTSIVPVIGALICAACMFAPYFIGA